MSTSIEGSSCSYHDRVRAEAASVSLAVLLGFGFVQAIARHQAQAAARVRSQISI
jgi:hypothetical protein